jgi:dTMP kinase
METKFKRGYFINFEGIEGVGKSTVIPFIENYLREHNINVVVTREPGGTEVGEKIRQIVLHYNDEHVHPDTELLLFFAARAQKLAEVIKPALAKGYTVLSDRFTDATYAYQGGGRGMDQQKIATLENLVQGDLRPDLVLILDLDPHLGLERVAKNRTLDRIEVEKLDFFHKVRNNYLERAAHDPIHYKVIDASFPLEQVVAKIKTEIDKLFYA